jgi:hypothetical protein
MVASVSKAWVLCLQSGRASPLLDGALYHGVAVESFLLREERGRDKTVQ